MKATIICTKKDLESIGIDYDIRGLCGYIVKSFPTGYYTVRITHRLNRLSDDFDLPVRFIKLHY